MLYFERLWCENLLNIFTYEVTVTKKTNKNNVKDLRELINQYELRPRKVIRIFFDLITEKPKINISPIIKKLTKTGKLNKVVYSDDYESFVHNAITINKFLDWLELSEKNKFMKILKIISIRCL